MTHPSDERRLATSLAALSPDALADLLADRGVSPSASWRDFFDAAAGLLDAASIDRALMRVPRPDLVALAAGTGTSALARAALVDADGVPFRAVTERVDAARALTPDAFAPVRPSSAPPLADAGAEAAAAERAFANGAALADVLVSALHAPLTRTTAGTVSAVDRRRLIEDGAISDGDQLDDLLLSAAAARLVRSSDRDWQPTRRGERWLQASSAKRWRRIARGFLRVLPSALRTASGGHLPAADWSAAYPLDPDWPERVARLVRIAERWGLVTPDGAETAWGARLRTGGTADAAAFAAHLPAEIDRIYLQADLSAIAPGLLAPAVDMRLRGITVRESRAQASTYRFTQASLTAGMTAGETPESITELLTTISLTGIPQPLAYLIESTAARHGLVRVGADDSGRTTVTSPDPSILDAVAVDQALRPLGLVHDGDVLRSRVGRESVYWALADARYPVIALDADGHAEPLHRRRPSLRKQRPESPYEQIVARLRASHDENADAAWLSRELDQAVRTRSDIVVAVRLPDGTSREFTLEATGLGGGRLRGRDRRADIERTLPVSSIESVRPA